MTRGAETLVKHTWRGSSVREVYADFNDLTLQITTDALFGFKPSNPESKRVTGNSYLHAHDVGLLVCTRVFPQIISPASGDGERKQEENWQSRSKFYERVL